MARRDSRLKIPESGSEHLLALALSRPQEAMARARAILASHPDSYEASICRQAVGVVQRDFGEVSQAIHEFRAALRLARASGRPHREADVLASLGVALVKAGRTHKGLATLDQAIQRSHGAFAGRILIRRANVFWVLGKYDEALEDLRSAVTALRRAGDTVWEARALTHRTLVHLAVGAIKRANADAVLAERLFASSGQELEFAMARHNAGLVAFASGDLPTALAYLDEAGRRYEALATPMPDLPIDRCAVLLAAGLMREAFHEAEAGAQLAERSGWQATKRAELLFAAATAALADGDPMAARERAQHAVRLFRAQRRAWWEARAEFLLIQARHAAGDRSSRLLAQAVRIAGRLDELHAEEAPQAHLLAGRAALRRDRDAEAGRHLETAATCRRRGPPLIRSVGWLARALHAEAAGNVRGTLAACSRGLDALDEHRLTLGATELRAHATVHGAELAMIAQREALRRGDTRRLLAWSERWRATALAVAPPRLPDDKELTAELSALREVVRRLEAAYSEGAATATLERERRRLEDAVRARTRRTSGTVGSRAERFDVDALLAGLGDARLVELVEVDGVLHVIVAGDGRVRRHTAGDIARAERDVQMARFTLRRLAFGRAAARAAATLEQGGRELEQALLGPAAADLGDGPLLVVPPGRLHAVPWALLPSLRDRAVSVAPSAAIWLRAGRARPPSRRRVTLVAGPDLGSGGAEVPRLVSRYAGATVLERGSATAERVLAALDGAWLAHIAAHGTFRADNPLFSALRLADGPLTVYDFERLRRAPYRLVLSTCESAVAAPVGADELLGLASSLMPLGAAGVVASVVPVDDAAVVPLMVALHDNLQSGATLPEALLRARNAGADDPVTVATGVSFVALGR